MFTFCRTTWSKTVILNKIKISACSLFGCAGLVFGDPDVASLRLRTPTHTLQLYASTGTQLFFTRRVSRLRFERPRITMPGAPSSFLLLVAMPFAPSSVLAPSSDARSP